VRFGGHVGATSGVFVAPSSTIFAEALAGSTARANAARAKRTTRERFIGPLNTTARSQVAPGTHRAGARSAARDRQIGEFSLAARGLELDDVDCLRAFRAGLLLIGDLGALGQRAVAIAV